MRILVVEDDEILADNLRLSLSSWGHEPDISNNGTTAIARLKEGTYDLAILDIELPDISGLEVCAEYRKTGGSALVLFLTGRNSMHDKLLGYEVEADEYICKPFSFEELKARLEALMRRTGPLNHDTLVYRSISLNTANRQVQFQDKQIKLAPLEFALLEFLMRHSAVTFSAEQLIERVWTADSMVSAESVRSAIKGIRKKLRDAGAQDVIENIPATGYRLRN